jgi:hypothetical protein
LGKVQSSKKCIFSSFILKPRFFNFVAKITVFQNSQQRGQSSTLTSWLKDSENSGKEEGEDMAQWICKQAMAHNIQEQSLLG